jgi:histidinol-phosphatase (PHP family)
MTSQPILYETHMHTPLCKHAKGEPEAYAAMAEQRGLKGIIVTCHNPTDNGWAPEVRMRIDQLEDYVALVDRARQTWTGRVDVRLGLESDYAPGMEAWLEKLHGLAEFDYILGSVHAPLPDYKDRYFNGDIVAFQRLYFEHLAMSAETGLFDSLAHPDLVKIVHPAEWQVERLLDDIRYSLDRIAAAGVAMELNTSGLNKPLPEMNPGRPILAEMVRRGIPVVVGADAHEPQRVAANFEDAFDLLQAVGYTQVNIFLNRQRRALDLETARRSLRTN